MTAARGLHAGAQLRLVGGSRLLLQLRLRGTRGAPWPLTLKPKTAPPAARTVDLMHPHSPATGRFTSSVSRGSTTFTAHLLAEHMRCSAASASAAASSGVLTGPQSAKRGSQHEITDAKRACATVAPDAIDGAAPPASRLCSLHGCLGVGACGCRNHVHSGMLWPPFIRAKILRSCSGCCLQELSIESMRFLEAAQGLYCVLPWW